MVERIIATDSARALIAELRRRLGPLAVLLRYGYGGRTQLRCVARERLPLGMAELPLGEIDGCPVYVRGSDRAHWQYLQLSIDTTQQDAALQVTPASRLRTGLVAQTRRFSTEEWALLSVRLPRFAVPCDLPQPTPMACAAL